MRTKIIEAEDDVAAQAAALIEEHGAENVATDTAGTGLRFIVSVDGEDEPTDEPAPKPAAKKATGPKTAATPAAPES